MGPPACLLKQVLPSHAGCRLGNLMLAQDPAEQVLAPLDSQMAMRGDPLADLGYLTVTWSDPAWEST